MRVALGNKNCDDQSQSARPNFSRAIDWPRELARVFSCEEQFVSVEKFLRQRAIKIAVDGSYSLPNWHDREGKPRTFACRTTRVSPFRMMVDVPVVGKLGDRLTSYFPDFGKFDGSISDVGDGSFLLELEMTPGDAGALCRQAGLAGEAAVRSRRHRGPQGRAVHSAQFSHDADHGRRQRPHLFHHRRLRVGRGDIGRATPAGRHAAGGRRLRRPGGPRTSTTVLP